MPAEITMPQLSDTMTEGKLVKWHKKEGDKVREGEEIAEIETDKATMPMEAFDAGVLAYTAAREGDQVQVGGLIAVIATAGEDPAEVKKQFARDRSGAARPAAEKGAAEPANPSGESARQHAKPAGAAAAPAEPEAQAAPQRQADRKPAPVRIPPGGKKHQYDLIVIGGGPAGYAAAIRAGQLKKRVLCIEKENLGGTCLNWGCIPTKALLEDGSLVRRLHTEAAERGIKLKGLELDFGRMISRSRGIADKLQKGIGHLFRKYEVKHELGTGQLLGPNRVKLTTRKGSSEVTAGHIILAVGASATQLPGMEFDGKTVIGYREAMTLSKQPKRLAVIGAGAIGCEFADFYNSIGTEVTIVEMLDHLLPNEDEEVSILLERLFKKRGITLHLKTKTEKLEKAKNGVKLNLAGGKTVEADVCLVAVGVTPNTADVAAKDAGLEIEKKRIRVSPDFRTSLENVWAVGDCIALHFPEQEAMGGYRHPDLAHVAHHEAVYCVERIFGVSAHQIDYRFIPGCTYTHPQVASLGLTEKKAREQKRQIRIGKFPLSVSGRALAAGQTDGFVKLIFDEKYGELLGAHMIGENVTEILAELVLARKLEATEAEIIEAMHPHPTISEAIMEAAGVADGRAIHL